MKNIRVTKVLNKMQEENIPQLIISDPAAIFYLTGKWIFPGERMLVLYLNLNGKHKLFINELFPVYEDLGVEKVWFKDTDDSVLLLSQHISKYNTIGIDKNWPSRFLLSLMSLCHDGKFVNGSGIIDQIRNAKDQEEQQLMRNASAINDMAVDKLIKGISENASEIQIAEGLSKIYKDLGAQGNSFDPIIAYGKNAADPHHEPDDNSLHIGDSIIMDIGCKKDSYCSDMTRTVFYKTISEESKLVYNTVLEANKRAIDIIKPGVRFCDIDAAARNLIESKGFGKYFTHRTGHSIGIEVHEYGDVSAINKNMVQPGMIFSIEPGIYLTDKVGVRIEDLVLVTQNGVEVLNKYTKELIIVE